MASTLPYDSERRAAGVRRVPVERIVDVCAASAASAPAFQGWSMNVSGRGMSVRATHLPELAAPLVMRFQEHGSEVIAEAVVVWRNETPRGAEFGVRFTALDSRSVQALKELCQTATLRSVSPEPPPGIFDVPEEPRGEEHDTERAPPAASPARSFSASPASVNPSSGSPSSVKLHIEGLAAPMQAQVRQQGERRLALGSQLEFLRVGRNVEVEDVSLGDRRAACIDAVDVSIDPESRVPELVVSLRYDAVATPAPAGTGPSAAATKPDPSKPGATKPGATKAAASTKPTASSPPAFGSGAATPPMPSGMQMMAPPGGRTPPAAIGAAPSSARERELEGAATSGNAPPSAAPATAKSPTVDAAPASSEASPASVKSAQEPASMANAKTPSAPASSPTLVEPKSDSAPRPATAAEHAPRAEPRIVVASAGAAPPPAASFSDDADEGDVPLDELGVPVDEEQDDALSEPFRRLSTQASVDAEDELPPSRPSLEIEESVPSEAERLRQRLDGVLDGLSSAARLAGERCRSLGEAASHGARSVAERARRAGQQALAQRAASPRRRTAAPPRSLRNTGSRTLPRSQNASGAADAAARPRVSQRTLLGASLLGVVIVGAWLGLGRGAATVADPGTPAATAAQPAAVQAPPADAVTPDPPAQRPRVLLPPEEGEPEDVAEPTGVVAQVPLFGPTSLGPASAPERATSARGAIATIEKRALARAKPAGDDFEPPRPAARRKPAAPPEFRSGRLELPIVHRLRLDRPGQSLRGERTATGFDVIVPGRKTMESANTIARRDHRIAKVTTRNGAEGARVSFRFRSDIPAYKVRLRNDYIEFFISSD